MYVCICMCYVCNLGFYHHKLYPFIARHACVGLFSVTGPVYVSEMAPSHVRGKLGLINFLMTGGGVFGGSVAAGLFSIDTQHAYTFGWRFGKHK